MLYIDTSTYTCVYAFVLDNGICRERILQSQKPPGAPLQQPGKRTQAARNARAGQERPRAARSSQEKATARAATSSTRASAQTRSRSSPRRPQDSPETVQERPSGGPKPEEGQEWPRSGPAAASTANGYPYMKSVVCRPPATRRA